MRFILLAWAKSKSYSLQKGEGGRGGLSTVLKPLIACNLGQQSQKNIVLCIFNQMTQQHYSFSALDIAWYTHFFWLCLCLHLPQVPEQLSNLYQLPYMEGWRITRGHLNPVSPPSPRSSTKKCKRSIIQVVLSQDAIKIPAYHNPSLLHPAHCAQWISQTQSLVWKLSLDEIKVIHITLGLKR